MFLVDTARDILSVGLVRLGVSVLVLYVVSSVVYTLYLHPLADYPGPFWARLSTFPSWIHTLKQDRHLWLYRLHEQYGKLNSQIPSSLTHNERRGVPNNEYMVPGPRVRYRPDSLAINTPTAFREITGPKGNGQRTQAYQVWPYKAGVESIIHIQNNTKHGRKRRALMNAFSDRALRSYEPLVQQNVDRWCELLGDECAETEDEWSKPLNVADWLNWFVFDVMGDVCLGKSFGMKERDSDMRIVLHVMASMMAVAYPVSSLLSRTFLPPLSLAKTAS